MLDIFSREPVNKTASLVTSQSGCASDGTLSNEQIIENLVGKLKSIEVDILACEKGSKKRKERKALCFLLADSIANVCFDKVVRLYTFCYLSSDVFIAYEE